MFDTDCILNCRTAEILYSTHHNLIRIQIHRFTKYTTITRGRQRPKTISFPSEVSSQCEKIRFRFLTTINRFDPRPKIILARLNNSFSCLWSALKLIFRFVSLRAMYYYFIFKHRPSISRYSNIFSHKKPISQVAPFYLHEN